MASFVPSPHRASNSGFGPGSCDTTHLPWPRLTNERPDSVWRIALLIIIGDVDQHYNPRYDRAGVHVIVSNLVPVWYHALMA